MIPPPAGWPDPLTLFPRRPRLPWREKNKVSARVWRRRRRQQQTVLPPLLWDQNNPGLPEVRSVLESHARPGSTNTLSPAGGRRYSVPIATEAGTHGDALLPREPWVAFLSRHSLWRTRGQTAASGIVLRPQWPRLRGRSLNTHSNSLTAGVVQHL